MSEGAGKIIDVLRHGEPEGWPDAAAMQEAWDREEKESAALVCEWVDDEGSCPHPAIYRTHWHKLICRGHGSILMVNHGLDYLVDLPELGKGGAA